MVYIIYIYVKNRIILQIRLTYVPRKMIFSMYLTAKKNAEMKLKVFKAKKICDRCAFIGKTFAILFAFKA